MSGRTLLQSQALRSLSLSRVAASRSLSTTARLGLKESSSQTDVDNEKHKQDSLAKQKRGEGHWKRELASDSEEAVKADRTNASPEELQKQTKDHAEEASKAGTSSTRHGL